jgi:hypothetical protein
MWRPAARVLVSTLAVAFVGWAQTAIVAEDIPQGASKPFDFPKSRKLLERYLRESNIAMMRLHAWHLFAGLTGTALSGLPRFRTWYSLHEVGVPDGERHVQYDFLERAREFQSVIEDFQNRPEWKNLGEALRQQARDAVPLSSIYFNPVAFGHVRREIVTQGKATRLCNRADIDALTAQFESSTPRPQWEQWKVADFPNSAVVAKAVWWVVTKNERTVLPVWDPPPGNLITPGDNPKTKWSRVVLVDPELSPTEIKKGDTDCRTFAGVNRCGPVVSLHSFYWLRLNSQSMVDAVIRNDVFSGGNTPALNDFLVLTGLHFTTKEIPNWVWATAWWHPEPNRGPFGRDRPNRIKEPWTNYLMNVSYDMTLPDSSHNGSPHACFNPYLEGERGGGTFSNCMTCHRLAAVPDAKQETLIGQVDDGDLRLQHKVKVDFLWSLARENGNTCRGAATPLQ